MFILKITRKFDAAHKVKGYKGKCANLHGHTWKVIFYFKFSNLNSIGIAKDFVEIKQILDELLPDHKYLNEIFTFNPTAENLAKYFYELVKNKLPVMQVEVYETEDNCALYIEDK